jgi:hypothetical protein
VILTTSWPNPEPKNYQAHNSPKPIPPAQRRGLATQIPSIPNFKLGYAEKERQNADIRLAERKAKTGHIQPIPTVHFSVGVANFEWDEFAIDEGRWTLSPNFYTVTEDNRFLTSSELLASILAAVQAQTKRKHLKHWVSPPTPGDWCFGHTNPSKVIREIAT